MKILVVSQFYWPENFRITDIAETLVERGHDVTVLTGLPNYPQGTIYPEYRHGKNRVQERNGVKIVRAKLIGRRRNVFFRLLNYYSFPFFASKLAKKLDKDFDVVLINELSPILGAIPGIKYAKKNKVRCVMYEMDLWPGSLLAGGISPKSWIYKHYEKVSAKIYSGCDEILVSTKEHKEAIHSLPGCKDLSIHYLPQCADPIFEQTLFPKVDNGVIDLMFASNIGLAQSCDTIVEAARILKGDKRFLFHFIGDGTACPKLKKLVADYGLDNVIFHGRQPLEKMVEFYSLADAMLVTLEDKPYARMTIPGKVQSYLACGKPIIGAISGSCANFIRECGAGMVVEAEDSAGLARIITEFAEGDYSEFGRNGRDYYFEHLSQDRYLKDLQKYLTK
ncbi:MAG: glycosyltransferase family 4 protein [Candidatus Enteromonas sp.]|nr:glycosyltransferase family 4 protein [Candidatus Enteromonas sp.]